MKNQIYQSPRFQISDVQPIALQVAEGPEQWLILADYLNCARICFRNKTEISRTVEEFEGINVEWRLHKKLRLSESQVTMLIKAYLLAVEWDAGRVERCLKNRKPIGVGYSAMYRASLKLRKVGKTDQEAKETLEAELKKKFENKSLKLSDVMPTRSYGSGPNYSSYRAALQLATDNGIDSETLKRLIEEHLARQQGRGSEAPIGDVEAEAGSGVTDDQEKETREAA